MYAKEVHEEVGAQGGEMICIYGRASRRNGSSIADFVCLFTARHAAIVHVTHADTMALTGGRLSHVVCRSSKRKNQDLPCHNFPNDSQR